MPAIFSHRRAARHALPPSHILFRLMMIRTSLILAALLAGAAVPAAAQGNIRPGQTVRGELSTSDPTLADDSYHDIWRFRAEAGHTYAVTLRSDDFDAYLAVGSSAGDDCEECETDDDGAGGTDSRVEFRADASGTYEIRANALSADETGDYTLELQDLGQVQQAPAEEVSATPIRLGQRVQGELTGDDPAADDGSYYDLYSFQGRAGQTITITLRSDDFDAFLTIGMLDGGEYAELDGNDDGPDGTDSELTITLSETGEYLIHANSLNEGETGAYTLQITGS